MTAAFLVPLDVETSAARGDRADVWAYVLAHLAEHAMPICTGVPSSDAWVKAQAVDDAARRALPYVDVFVVHDADVIVAPIALAQAIDVVERGDVAWAVPHRLVYRYDAHSTADVLARRHGRTPTLVRYPYDGKAGGGIVVLRRDVYGAVPLDQRFVGWGGEDEAWGWALETLHGKPWRGGAPLVHLDHPHATGLRYPLRPPRIDSHRLMRSYRAAYARADVDAMRALVDGGRVASGPDALRRAIT